MGIFALLSRPVSTVEPAARADWSELRAGGVAARFEAVAEALVVGFGRSSTPCAVAGTQMAKDGAVPGRDPGRPWP